MQISGNVGEFQIITYLCSMHIVKLNISDSPLGRVEQGKITAYLEKLNTIFKYKGFMIEWSFSDKEYRSLYIDKGVALAPG